MNGLKAVLSKIGFIFDFKTNKNFILFRFKDHKLKVGHHLCMTQLEEHFKEGIFENS
jgi:hypothetical protein